MTKKERMYQQIERHGNNLNAIFNTGMEPIKLCKKLHSLEVRAHKLATDYCNGDNGVSSENIDILTAPIRAQVAKIIGESVPIMFNGDARGYALKISDKYVREHDLKIHTDMGGYGILAPEFNGN